MLNSYHRQTEVLQYFLVTFDRLCSITEKQPMGITKTSCGFVSASSNIFLPSVGTSPLRGETASILGQFMYSFQGKHQQEVVKVCIPQ